MSLLVLPPDVKEYIAVHAAAAGFPIAIAALAQTCRALRALIYNPSDHHLWREVFLTTFDDPRTCHYIDIASFEWGSEFRRRIWVAAYLRSHTYPLPAESSHNLRSHKANAGLPDVFAAESARLLYTLLSVIKTSAPGVRTHGFEDLGPLINGHNLPYASQCTPLIVSPPVTSPSLNVGWLRKTLERGLPPSVIAKLSGEFLDEKWLVTPEAQALCRLVCCIGFLPIHQPQEERPEAANASPSRAKRKSKSSPRKNADPPTLDMSIDAQKKRARYRARECVYDLDYLKRRRHWGPFRPVLSSASAPIPPSPSSPLVSSSPTSEALYSMLHQSDLDSSSSDSEFVPADDDAARQSSATPPPQPEPDFSAPARRRRAPTAAQLQPDWAWLAAARIVCETNLREKVADQETIDGLCRLDGVREYVWIHAAEGVENAGEDAAESGAAAQEDANAEASQVRDGEVPGWDWAGVEGVWRRCVCWLDYSDLIDHNTIGQFDDPTLEEAMLIVPLRLRIVGYEPPAIAAHVNRPTIKVEGEMGGASWAGTPDFDDDVRKIYGTVATVSDGSIRWSLTSSDETLYTDQWVSEGIQIGGVGSAMGVLGMWTGATHENDDPLGPFWAWRVA